MPLLAIQSMDIILTRRKNGIGSDFYMDVENIVFDYWQARCQDHDRKLQQLALDRLRPMVEQITMVIGYIWGEELEKLLITACLNYSRSSGQSFMVYFIHKMRSAFRLTYDQESKMLQAVTE